MRFSADKEVAIKMPARRRVVRDFIAPANGIQVSSSRKNWLYKDIHVAINCRADFSPGFSNVAVSISLLLKLFLSLCRG